MIAIVIQRIFIGAIKPSHRKDLESQIRRFVGALLRLVVRRVLVLAGRAQHGLRMQLLADDLGF